MTGNHILASRTSILETLEQITNNGGASAIPPKYTISSLERVLLDVRLGFVERPILCSGVVLAMAGAFVAWLRGRRKRRGGHFRLDDGLGIRDHKESFGGNAKAD